MKLLSEEETRNIVNSIIKDTLTNNINLALFEDKSSYIAFCTDLIRNEILALINSQKIAHGEYVIGEDKNTQYTEEETKGIAGEYLIPKLRKEAMENSLRAEQRERNTL